MPQEENLKFAVNHKAEDKKRLSGNKSTTVVLSQPPFSHASDMLVFCTVLLGSNHFYFRYISQEKASNRKPHSPK